MSALPETPSLVPNRGNLLPHLIGRTQLPALRPIFYVRTGQQRFDPLEICDTLQFSDFWRLSGTDSRKISMGKFSGKDLTCIRGQRRVFSNLDFDLDEGGALILTGPNGSGKSSLLRLMAGLLPPATGAVCWDGTATSDDPEAHGGRLHYVGHLDAVKPVLSVAENISFWASLRVAAPDLPGRVNTALKAFGISHLADIPGRVLSAGQKRRVNLARIIAAPAPLWLLDEPTTALDRETIDGLEGLIVDHRAAGGMVVISTHSELHIDAALSLDLGTYSAGPITLDMDVAI